MIPAAPHPNSASSTGVSLSRSVLPGGDSLSLGHLLGPVDLNTIPSLANQERIQLSEGLIGQHKACEGVQNKPPPNMPLYHSHYVEQKALETLHVQEGLPELPASP